MTDRDRFAAIFDRHEINLAWGVDYWECLPSCGVTWESGLTWQQHFADALIRAGVK